MFLVSDRTEEMSGRYNLFISLLCFRRAKQLMQCSCIRWPKYVFCLIGFLWKFKILFAFHILYLLSNYLSEERRMLTLIL